MLEPNDFEQIARPLIAKLSDTMDPENAREMVLEQLRQVWNARGVADVSILESYGYAKHLVEQLRTQDR